MGQGPEPRGEGRASDQVVLFNAATAATVVLGVISLYLVLVLLAPAGAGLLITPDALSAALGAGLETDDAVREAAYAYRG